MPRCPHCNAESIGYFAKHASWQGGPAKCTGCGGLSFIAKHDSAWARLAGVLMLPGLTVLLLFWSWTTLAVVVTTFIALLVAAAVDMQLTPMLPTTEADVADSKRWGNGFIIAIGIGCLAFAAYAWHIR